MYFFIMSDRFATRDFLFVDESGDPGLGPGSSSGIVVGCFHLTDIGLEQFHRHFSAMTYFRTKLRELKSSRLSRLQKDQVADILKWLRDNDHASFSAAFVNKRYYTGPYLKPNTNQPPQPTYFRNFLNRQLLERHFQDHQPVSQKIEIVFDRVVAEPDERNFKQYLRGNLRLPRLDAITQCDSRTVPALQFVDTMVHIVKETLFGKSESVDGRLLDCMTLLDLTNPVRFAGSK